MRTAIHETGVIHGRFQVLHKDHLKYLLAGKSRCRHLFIGLTNPDPFLTKTETADPVRSIPSANPLTYYERLILLKAALGGAGIPDHEYSVVPFPIHMPERYLYYVPLNAVFYLTIYDDWGRKKLDFFRSLGLKIDVMWEAPPEQKGITGSEVRQKIQNGSPWEHLTPPQVPPFIREWDIAGRLAVFLRKSEET